MIIETKRTIGDFVYVMHDNKPIQVEVTGIYTLTTPASYPNSIVSYMLHNILGPIPEGDVHSTKEALLQSL